MASFIAQLWAKYILKGEKTYSEVPKYLKPGVKEILTDQGIEVEETESESGS